MKANSTFEIIKKYSMVIVLILVVLLFNVATGGRMLFAQNINNLIAQNAYVFVLATGMLFCILTGGNIDLSVGSVVCFVGAIGGVLLKNLGYNPIVSLVIMILLGLLAGAIQGFCIGYIRIPPFIVTLAGMLAFRGLSNVILNGTTISPMPDGYSALFNGYVPELFKIAGLNGMAIVLGVIGMVLFTVFSLIGIINKSSKGDEHPLFKVLKVIVIDLAILFFTISLASYKGIPNVLIWLVVIIAIYTFISQNTKIGRYFYAVGGNEKATKLSGINTNLVYFMGYLNMGLLAGMAGAITIARLNSANPTAGTNYEMDAIAACFIGGASAYGGVGTVPGVIIGALLMGVLNLGMSILGVDQNMQKVVKGVVLLAAVIFDVVSKRKAFIVK